MKTEMQKKYFIPQQNKTFQWTSTQTPLREELEGTLDEGLWMFYDYGLKRYFSTIKWDFIVLIIASPGA